MGGNDTNGEFALTFAVRSKRHGLALVMLDEVDADLLDGPAWCVNLYPSYSLPALRVLRNQVGAPTKSGRRTEYLHRVIAERATGRRLLRLDCVDHINGDTLDARRENLRVVTWRQNQQNAWSHRAGRLPGASPERGRWKSTIRINGRKLLLGYFDTEEAAHARYLEELERMGQTLVEPGPLTADQ